jgi:hypothetical protein
MNSEDTYYSVLEAAVSEIQRDSFETRGAIYDRVWQNLLQRFQANQGYSANDIERERAAFLRAIQSIEFGGGQPLLQPDVPHDAHEAAPQGVGAVRPALRPPVLRRAAIVSAALLVAVVLSTLIAMRSDSAAIAKWVSDGVSDSWRSQATRAVLALGDLMSLGSGKSVQRAIFFEEGAKDGGANHVGRATWQTSPGSAGDAGPVLSVDVNIPQRDLALRISLQRAADGGTVISHVVEFRFTKSNQSPSDEVRDVLGILMKSDEHARGIELVGKVVNVHPGVFLMGLSGAEADIDRNLSLLRDRPWLDIPIILKGGSRSIVAIEKGPTGHNALKEVLATWGQS